jgi:hypothetical protein
MALTRRCLVALAALAAAACSPSRPPPASCTAGPGALVITEIFANPDGTDTGKEWFEIFNPGDEPAELAGLSLMLSKADGSGQKKLTLPATAPALDPGAYLVFGDHRTGEQPAWLGFTYADRLGSMGNTGGKLAVSCGATEVDSVTWTRAQKSGQSVGFDGAKTPNAVDNDPEDPWCYSTVSFAAGIRGSPGAPNEPCPTVSDPNTCFDPASGERRATRPPAAGELFFSEIMANPHAASDSAGEWLELYAAADVDLNGLEVSIVGGSKAVLSDTNCLAVTAGTYSVLARRLDPEENGGLENVAAVFTFDLPNTGDRALELKAGDVVVDRAPYANPADGKSLQANPQLLDATANDAPESWCPATAALPSGDFGTPGAENSACAAGPQPGTCVDPLTATARAPVPPTAGQLVITEFMANPKAVDDTKGEWIELLAMAAFDLNGVELRNEDTGRTTFASADCLSVAAGDLLLFARSTDPAQNGGLENVKAAFGFSLSNSGARAIVVAHGADELDRITYGAVGDGVSRQLDPGSLDATANDADTTWCNGTDALASGDKGSPGAPNRSCAP